MYDSQEITRALNKTYLAHFPAPANVPVLPLPIPPQYSDSLASGRRLPPRRTIGFSQVT